MEIMSKRAKRLEKFDGKGMAALLRSLAAWSHEADQSQQSNAYNKLAEVFDTVPEQELSTILAKLRSRG